MNTKPKLGIFAFTGCAGCEVTILNQEDVLLDIASSVNIVRFDIAKEKNYSGKVDVAIIEGAVITKEEQVMIKEIRDNAGILIAIGGCACHGGIPSMKNFINEKEFAIESVPIEMRGAINPKPIDQFVKVDHYIKGCPPDGDEFVRAVKDLLLGKKPHIYNAPVCLECKMNENICLLMERNLPCMGSITCGGCNAACTTGEVACSGCRGPIEDSNVDSFVEIMQEKGYKLKDIKQRISKFAGLSKKFEKLLDILEEYTK